MSKSLREKKKTKDSFITVRISSAEKDIYLNEAENLGMGLSEFVLYLLRHRKINVIEGGSEIAHAMYNLNDTLNKCARYPQIPVQNINRSISENLNRINNFLNDAGEKC